MLTEEGNLISTGASIIRAASNGDADAVETLLAEGTDVDQRGRGGHTALMVAAIFSHVDIADLLLDAGANVQLKDNLGLTAKDWAERRGSWEVAQLLSNASSFETEASPQAVASKQPQLELETRIRSPEVDPETALQQDAPTVTEEQIRTKAGQKDREVGRDLHPSAVEPTIAPTPDALRFMKFHKQIMAAQERRKAEQAQREAEQTQPLIETNIAPHDTLYMADHITTLLSAQAALATGSTNATSRETSPHPSPVETNPPHQSSTDTTLSETNLYPFPIDTNGSHQPAPNIDQQTAMVDPGPGKTESVRPTFPQLARIATTIEHLRLLEETRQGTEGEASANPESADVTAAGLELDHDDHDITIEHQSAETSTRPAMPKPKISESSSSSRSKRCPECHVTYEDPLLVYCAYDATKLIGDDASMFSYSVTKDRSRQALWALAAIVTVLGASLGYLINNYRSREKAPSVPVAAASNVPLASQTGQPEITRNDRPFVSGELSGMEVDVPNPEYPLEAKAEGISGTVTVRIQANKKGRVIMARSSDGDWRLRAAAVEAAQKATFSPEKLAAHENGLSGTITYNFAAQTASSAATGSPVPATANPSSATGTPAATEGSASNASGNSPVVEGPLVGAESKLPKPDYPAQARSKGIRGTITVVVRVNRAGKVISWRTLEGDSQLRAAALKAAKKATFSPDKLPGKGEVVGSITYNFK